MNRKAPGHTTRSLLAFSAAAILHIAMPLAVSGQSRGVLTARATVVEAQSAWTAHRLVEDATRSLDRIPADDVGPVRARSEGPVVVWVARLEDGTREVTVAHTGS